jgi:hypothetical protein
MIALGVTVVDVIDIDVRAIYVTAVDVIGVDVQPRPPGTL